MEALSGMPPGGLGTVLGAGTQHGNNSSSLLQVAGHLPLTGSPRPEAPPSSSAVGQHSSTSEPSFKKGSIEHVLCALSGLRPNSRHGRHAARHQAAALGVAPVPGTTLVRSASDGVEQVQHVAAGAAAQAPTGRVPKAHVGQQRSILDLSNGNTSTSPAPGPVAMPLLRAGSESSCTISSAVIAAKQSQSCSAPLQQLPGTGPLAGQTGPLSDPTLYAAGSVSPMTNQAAKQPDLLPSVPTTTTKPLAGTGCLTSGLTGSNPYHSTVTVLSDRIEGVPVTMPPSSALHLPKVAVTAAADGGGGGQTSEAGAGAGGLPAIASPSPPGFPAPPAPILPVPPPPPSRSGHRVSFLVNDNHQPQAPTPPASGPSSQRCLKPCLTLQPQHPARAASDGGILLASPAVEGGGEGAPPCPLSPQPRPRVRFSVAEYRDGNNGSCNTPKLLATGASDATLLDACFSVPCTRGKRLTRSITLGPGSEFGSSVASSHPGSHTSVAEGEDEKCDVPAAQQGEGHKGGPGSCGEGRSRAYARERQFLSQNARRTGGSRGALWLERSLSHIHDALRSSTPSRQLSMH